MDNILAIIKDNFIKLRKRQHLSQLQIAKLSSVSYGSIKRFENAGLISLESLSRLSIVLGVEDELKKLFTTKTYNSIQDVIDEQ